MKIRRLSAAALLAATLGTAALVGAAPALATPPGEPPPGFAHGPFATLEQCQVDRDLTAKRLEEYAWVGQCELRSNGWYFKGFYYV
ncbi:hypothetical protein ACFYY8_18630 [Streptosporangium sp. NPDC001559]|uniref:hypothetical protein n=1 Tax=Streptosporangium sp. NPDC001559 TaxID=3366187 RepID=UPI0036EE9CD6